MKRISLLLLMMAAVLITSCNQKNRYRSNFHSPYGIYGPSKAFDYGYGWRVNNGNGGTRIQYDY